MSPQLAVSFGGGVISRQRACDQHGSFSFPFFPQGTRMQHLSSINLHIRIAKAELVWMHYPEGSVEYIPHFCKEIMMKEKAREEVDRKNSRIKSWEKGWNQELSCREGKWEEISQGNVLVGVDRGRASPADAARGKWWMHKWHRNMLM